MMMQSANERAVRHAIGPLAGQFKEKRAIDLRASIYSLSPA
jgi:hypothetical protein